MPSLTHAQNAVGERYQENVGKKRVPYVVSFFDDFCKIQVQNLNLLGQLFQVVIHFHPGHRWPKTLINSFTVRLVRCLNQKKDHYLCLRFHSCECDF